MTSYDKITHKLFNNWLYINFFLIILMIIVGGLTRLTNSGLSITEWELVKGILPPLNQISWNNYFELYKKIPQFELINPNMTLNEFKIIYYWEYIHRVLGRLIGLFFIIPLLYFHFIRKINIKNLSIYYFVLVLIIIQGIVGWYMVKSGLVNNTTVSHYRLSLHLSMAIIILSIIFWQILNLKNNLNLYFFRSIKNNIQYFFLIFLIFSQVIMGAFVSGLDAGLIYQTWPLMGLNYFPDDLIIKNINSIIDFNNHSLVQFYHRNLAYIISAYIIILSFFIFKNKNHSLISAAKILLFILFIQILLGVSTLISGLNILLASAHQIFSIILVFSALNLYYKAIK